MTYHANYEPYTPTFVLMAGLPGAGKTTLAFALGKTLRWLVLDKDMYKGLLLTMGMIDELASAMAYELLFEIAYDLLARQHMSIIFDSSALHLFVITRALAITHTAHARLKVVLCSANDEVRHARMSARNSGFSPSLVHTVPLQDDRFLFSHLPADALVLHTIQPFEECVERAILYLCQ